MPMTAVNTVHRLRETKATFKTGIEKMFRKSKDMEDHTQHPPSTMATSQPAAAQTQSHFLYFHNGSEAESDDELIPLSLMPRVQAVGAERHVQIVTPASRASSLVVSLYSTGEEKSEVLDKETSSAELSPVERSGNGGIDREKETSGQCMGGIVEGKDELEPENLKKIRIAEDH